MMSMFQLIKKIKLANHIFMLTFLFWVWGRKPPIFFISFNNIAQNIMLNLYKCYKNNKML